MAEIEFQEKIKTKKGKVALVDIGGSVTYSLIVGSVLDYISGLNFFGIVTSRASATAINSATGGPYGWWREKTFNLTKTKNQHPKFRKYLVDLLAFNTFQVPIYATSLGIGSFVSEGDINWEKVIHGSEYLVMISPLIGPTMGIYMDGFRKMFKVKSASEGEYSNKTFSKPL